MPGFAFHEAAVKLLQIGIFESFTEPLEAFTAPGFDQGHGEELVQGGLALAHHVERHRVHVGVRPVHAGELPRTLAIDGKKFDYKTNERLQKALELKLFEDQKDTIKLTSLVSNVIDKETQDRIDIIKDRLIKYYGYNEASAKDVLSYVASIFARGNVVWVVFAANADLKIDSTSIPAGYRTRNFRVKNAALMRLRRKPANG